MKNITYQGPADARVLAGADLAKAGVEDFEDTVFGAHVPVKVVNKVADALIGNPELFGNFGLAEEDDAEPSTATAEGAEVASTESAQESTGTPSAGAANAAGSSTRTR